MHDPDAEDHFIDYPAEFPEAARNHSAVKEHHHKKAVHVHVGGDDSLADHTDDIYGSEDEDLDEEEENRPRHSTKKVGFLLDVLSELDGKDSNSKLNGYDDEGTPGPPARADDEEAEELKQKSGLKRRDTNYIN